MSTMNFRSAGAKVRRLLAPTNPAKLSASALTDDSLRDNVMREAEAASERFSKTIRKQPHVSYTDEQGDAQDFTWDTFPEAMRDVARAGFGWDEPEVRSRDQVRPSHRLNREVIQAYTGSEGFRESRPYTRNSELESQYGAMAAADSLADAASGVLKEHLKLSDEIEDAEGDVQNAADLWDKLKQQAKADVADTGTVQPGTRKGIKDSLKGQQAAQGALGDLMQQQLSSSMVVDAITAGEAAGEAAAEAADLISSMPGVEKGSASKVPVDQQIALAEKWREHEYLRKIALRMGRVFRSFVFKREARVKNVKIEPVSITTGNDLDRLLPQELAKAYIPGLRPLFIKDWSEHKLLQYHYEGKQPTGKGPIIVVIDGSGSMAGEPFVYASSIELALYMEARRTKRAFAAVEFGSRGEVASWLFPKDAGEDPEKVLDMASHFFGGGTDISQGMERAHEIVVGEGAFSTADICVITDGQDSFGERDLRIRNELIERHVRIQGISIGGYGTNAYLEQMCEHTLNVADIARQEDEIISTLAENIT